MGRVFSFGLDQVLEKIVLTSVGSARKVPAQGDPAAGALPTGQRRILEHVVMMSVEKRLKMPH